MILLTSGVSALMWVDHALGSTDGNVTHVTLILWLLVVFVPVFMVFRELLLVYGVILPFSVIIQMLLMLRFPVSFNKNSVVYHCMDHFLHFRSQQSIPVQ